MKTAISIPDHIFNAAEKIARRLGVSRSQLYTTAVSDFVRDHEKDGISEILNEIYAKESSDLDPISHALQYSTLKEEEW